MNYHVSFAARVRDLCYVGASNSEIASLLGVSVQTLERWRNEYPEFAAAWKDGKAHADAKVAASLFKRTQGYEIETWKETKDGRMREVKHIPPDVNACIFWLVNRRPENWQQRVEHVVPNGTTMDADALTELEAARRIAFALSKAYYQQQVEDKTRIIEHGSDRPVSKDSE